MAAYYRHQNPDAVRNDAREMYQSGMTVQAICRALRVSTATMQIWCGDLIAERRLQRSKNSKNPKPENFAGYTELTDDVVITIRQLVKASGRKNWKLYAGQYNTSIQHISDAVRGKTFAHLNEIEPPIAPKEVKRWAGLRGGKRLPPMSQVLLETLATLRRENPDQWTFTRLAGFAKEKTGKDHRPSTTARTLHRFDPSLKSLVTKKASLRSEKRSAEAVKRRLLIRQEIRQMMREEDAYEKWRSTQGD